MNTDIELVSNALNESIKWVKIIWLTKTEERKGQENL